jgi:hypothetical protein
MNERILCATDCQKRERAMLKIQVFARSAIARVTSKILPSKKVKFSFTNTHIGGVCDYCDVIDLKGAWFNYEYKPVANMKIQSLRIT